MVLLQDSLELIDLGRQTWIMVFEVSCLKQGMGL